jgi:hypothetical protein
LADVAKARDELVASMREDGTWQPMFGPLLAEVGKARKQEARRRSVIAADVCGTSTRLLSREAVS